jgi:hypothetical protein
MSKESWAFLAAMVSLLWNTMQVGRTLLGASVPTPVKKDRKATGLINAEEVVLKRSTLRNFVTFSVVGLVLSAIGFYLSLGVKSNQCSCNFDRCQSHTRLHPIYAKV